MSTFNWSGGVRQIKILAMKKVFLSISIAACLTLAAVAVKAQERKVIYIPAVPEWAPKQGFWVVESSKQSPRQSTIYFYNDDKVLVYKESVDGSRLKLKKEKVKLRLKKVLETALAEWSRNQQAMADSQWVANALRSN